jgi:hypothetical protein
MRDTPKWLLERQFPHDFAPCDRRPLPIEPKESTSMGTVYVGVPEGSFERLMASNARMREQMDKYPPGTKFDMKNSVIIPPDAPPLPPGEDYLD